MAPLLAPPQAEPGFSFPFLVYAAPNALFLLTAFFVLVRFEEYASYAYLYIAGKAVAIAANLGWFFFSLQWLGPALTGHTWETLSVLGFLLFLAGFDALSVLGMSALVMHILGGSKAGGKTAAEGAGDAVVPRAYGAGLPETKDAGSGVKAGGEE
ncbi:MAG: hypothetical protein LBF74_12760 [Treponema sp.]|nr:hypothetical protein [Treponema sp.]